MVKPWMVTFSGRVLWVVSAAIWAYYLAFLRSDAYLLDYHVHAGGAWDLLDGSIYRAELLYPGRLPIDRFNYPPLAAAIAIPFAALPESVGGTLWLIAGLVSVAVGMVLFVKLLGVRTAWAGLGFGLYTLHPWAASAMLGNINPLMFGVVMAFATLYLSRRQGWAGIALGIAIGLKLWPLAFLPLLVREHRWRLLAWGAGTLAVQGVTTIALLGVDVVPPMIGDLVYRLPPKPDDLVLNPWPAWLGDIAAVALVLLPTRGKVGLGLGILSGMLLVPNLWRHYLLTIIAGAGLIVAGNRDSAQDQRKSSPSAHVTEVRAGSGRGATSDIRQLGRDNVRA